MTKELEKICKEYNFNEDMTKLVVAVEEAFYFVVCYCMVEWIKVNTGELPHLDNMTDKE